MSKLKKALREFLVPADYFQPTLPGLPRTKPRHRARHSTESIRAKRRQRAEQLRGVGHTQASIAHRLRWSRSTIARDLGGMVRKVEAERPLHRALMARRGRMAQVANKIIRNYHPDDYGGGGPCDDIANELLSEALSVRVRGKEVDGDVRGWAGDHAFAVVWTDDEAYRVDVPYSLYEQGGGYNWEVDTEARISAHHVTIDELPISFV